ncbi:MAG: hypothetical protein K2W82_01305 [Candidatus Obscuribacterales bacterium]|nr:hypothetical protein [Candidatus Obscuribacterales bacterium]
MRNSRGQGLIEGAVGLVLIVTGIVLGTVLLLCTGYALNYKQKLAFVAHEVSAYVQSRGDWLGCTRPDYNPQKVQEEARQVADELMESLGMGAASDVTFTETTVGSNRYCRVTVTADRLQIPGAGILPNFIGLSETGASVDHSGDCWGYAWLRVNGTGSNRGVLVPVLAITGLNQNFDESSPLSCKVRGASLNCAFSLNGQVASSILKNGRPSSSSVASIAP